MRKIGIIDENLITFSSNLGTGDGKLGGEAWSPTETDLQPSVTISFPNRARVTSIMVQGGSNGFVQQFHIGIKETPEEFQYIKNINHEKMVILFC